MNNSIDEFVEKIGAGKSSYNMKKRNIPLSVPNLDLDILPYIRETIETGWVSTGGRFITEFEDKVKDFIDADFTRGVQAELQDYIYHYWL